MWAYLLVFFAALVVGEALWAALRPTGVAGGPRLELALPEALPVYAGAKNRFTVRVARQGFENPVRVEFVA